MKFNVKFFMELVFLLVFGTLIHFTYQFSGEAKAVGIFSAVNESTWEHLKLVFTPFFFLGIYRLIVKRHDILSLATGAIAGCGGVVVLFYTYTGIIGRNFLILDILTFVVGVCLGFYVDKKLTAQGYNCKDHSDLYGAAVFLIVFIVFVLFTFTPPHINLFLDPVTKTFGL